MSNEAGSARARRGSGRRPTTDPFGDRNGPLEHLAYAIVRATVGGLVAMPSSLRGAVLGGLARVARRLDRRHADAARRFIEQALGPGVDPERCEALVLGSYRHLAEVALGVVQRHRRIAPERVLDHYELEATPDVERFIAAGPPAVFITGHIGDWEAGPLYWFQRGFRPAHLMAKPPRNRPLSIWMHRMRERGGCTMLSRYGGMREAVSVLAKGGVLGMLLDHRAVQKPVLAPFFGRLARCERSSGVLLRRARVPAIVFACYRTERLFYYRIVAPRVLWPEDLEGRSPEEVAALVNVELEGLIRAAPEQYYWLHDRFYKTPTEAEVGSGLEAAGVRP